MQQVKAHLHKKTNFMLYGVIPTAVPRFDAEPQVADPQVVDRQVALPTLKL
jgi:hypothetical protein